MRVAVTGGSGFIGAHVIRQLTNDGHNVINVDLEAQSGGVVDIIDTHELVRVFQEFRPAVVFHIAAIADARAALADPVHAVQVNVGGTASVFEAARHTKTDRVVLASTCWVANAMRDGILDETAPFLPTGGGHVYTSTKIASELLAHDFHKLYGQKFTVLRYGIPYGPGMWPGLVLRSWLDSAANGNAITIFGDGSASRKFVYVEDLARAHSLALKDVAANQVYNIEGMRFITIRELAEVFKRHWGPMEIVYREEPTRIGEFQYFRKIMSNQKARVELGWEPRVDLENGVRQTIAWFRETHLSTEVADRARVG